MSIERKKQSGEIDESLRRKAEAIAIVMGGDYNMTVGVGPWGSGWHWDFVKNHVNMDARDLLEESEEVVFGVAAHEGNHKLASRPEHVMDLWPELGFSFGYNAVEDPRANETGMEQKPGTRPWIQAYIERDLSSGGGLDYKSIKKDTEQRLGYVPTFMQWGAEQIRYWYEKEFADSIQTSEDSTRFLQEIPDQSVRETVEKTADFFETYYKTIPHTRDEMDVQREAKKSATHFKEHVWPIYQKLVDSSLQDHAFVKMLEDMMRNAQGEEGNEGSGTMSIPFESLPKEFQDEIRQKMKQRQQQQKGSQQASEIGNNTGEQEESGSGKIPWDTLSEKAKEAVSQVFKQLPHDQQQAYQDTARSELEGVEDAANEKLRGEMNDPRHTETHKERQEREASDQSKMQQEQQSQIIAQELHEQSEEARNAIPRNQYFEYLSLPEVALTMREWDRYLAPLFQPTEEPETRFASSGTRVSMRRAMQRAADPRIDTIFSVESTPIEKNRRFTILVDLSSSMAGSTILETFKTVVPIAEKFNKYGLEFELVGFNSAFPGTINVYKPFEMRKLTQEARNTIGTMIEDCWGSTPTFEATIASFQRLKQRNQRRMMQHNYFITLTDGQPTSSSGEEIKRYLQKETKNRQFLASGFGVGYGTEFVNDCYPMLHDRIKQEIGYKLRKNPTEVTNSFTNSVEFGTAFITIIKYMIQYPELFFRAEK
jgi:hypothetical protein